MNGYNPSVVHKNQDRCYMCGIGGDLARHEPLDGIGRRSLSKHYGLWICVCPACHELSHKERKVQDELRILCQKAAMLEYGWTTADFIKIFGKSYI